MRRTAAMVAVLTAVAVLAACTSGGSSDSGSSDGGGSAKASSGIAGAQPTATEAAGLIPAKQWRKQQDEYLAFATKGDMDPTSPLSLLAYGAEAERASESAATRDRVEIATVAIEWGPTS